MGSRPLRIGMIGAGWVTAHHLEAWRELAGRASVVAICDPDAAAVAARAEAFGIAGRFASAEAMLDGAELDASTSARHGRPMRRWSGSGRRAGSR